MNPGRVKRAQSQRGTAYDAQFFKERSTINLVHDYLLCLSTLAGQAFMHYVFRHGVQ
jgi:hypothetical protein